MDSRELLERSRAHICDTYSRYNLAISRGRGCLLYDMEGREYVDFIAGIAVCNLGHCPPGLADVLYNQAQQLVHVSNLFYTQPQVELAEALTRVSFADKVFFCNSGAEAIEAAIKLARKYSRDHFGKDRYTIIAMEGSFHGRTMAAISATGQEKIHKGFEPLLPGFRHVQFNDLSAAAAAIDETVCAILVEPIQGEGGVRLPSAGYLAGLRQLCKENDLLLIYDEIQVGMGRTGMLFCYQHEQVAPDIMTLAKALANGLPIGAMLAVGEVANSFTRGSHASTFGGTPLVCAVACQVLARVNQEELLSSVQEQGGYFLEQLQQLQQRYAFIKDVRGRGLIVGLELDIPGQTIVQRCQERGFLINCTADRVLRFVPPLLITSTDIDRLVEALDEVFSLAG
ncbi:MAG: aspartate aminotransferase family protein [Deltaproteobacteria bacterium]|nr:aspartate aminotransferase family protein [Deltaproteobacteria bacterium]MBW2071914.1 aspartate aminotransferase family protein [Deltaproteobacteria bacterium]